VNLSNLSSLCDLCLTDDLINVKMNPLATFIRCNVCLSGPEVSVWLLSCKHLVCDPCLSRIRQANGGPTVCPFCKTAVRSVKTDEPEKLPPNIRALLFANPIELFKQANDVWEFQTGHAAIFFREKDKEIKRIREEGKAELVRSRNESMKMEAAISAAQERNLQLRKRLEEVQREQQARAYLPAGSVASPPIRRSRPESALSPDHPQVNSPLNFGGSSPVSDSGADPFKNPRFFTTPHFKKM